MCGIAGLLNADGRSPVDPGRLDRMVDALAHRGPDDRGCYVQGAIGIGVRRLAIVDVSDGHQPMASADGRIQLVYNGECYNHLELRSELEREGFVFRTRCDTEVVLHGYERWGIRGLCERMNGIFAFCVWDAKEGRAFLARDRLGVKPLYYVDRNRRLAFSSEVRALICSGLVTDKIDEIALWGYLTYQFTPGEATLLAGVRKLPPAHFLVWGKGGARLERYWDFPDRGEDVTADYGERIEALRALLEDTVERQMMSDVPIGCFLSGGLDSTIVASMMASRSRHAVRTFSIAFPEDPHCDEAEYFERVAQEIGAEHHTIDFSERVMLEGIEAFASAMDEPVADPAMLPTWLLAREAAKEVKVVLTGEGADEVFAGYPYYRPFLVGADANDGRHRRERDRAWLDLTRRLALRMGRFIPAPRNDLVSSISRFPYALDPEFLWSLLHPDRRPEPERLRAFAPAIERSAIERLPSASPLQAALAADTKLWLANDLMPKLDTMTMANSLEGRVPFLDHRVVEFAFTLPGRFKVGGGHGKRILRDAVRGVIPRWMVFREKHGFNVPLHQWFRGPLRELVREAVLGPTLADSGLFDRSSLEALLLVHQELDGSMARPLWALVCLERWLGRLRRELASGASADEKHPVEIGDGPARFPAPELDRGARATCDIVIPVYEGVHYVRDLLRSLREHTDYPSRVILIDDSANEATHRTLRVLVDGDPRVELHRNDANQGFVAAANRGFELSRAEYVCLMNSDVIVTAGWLGKMIRCAESDPRIAIVNPLCNSAVNLSVPMPPGLNLNTMADQIERHSRRRYPDITTAVGFCMLVKRRTLEWLGGFDPIYGHGYCEESDLCMRYTEAGLRVVAADDAFVYHKGCGSFGTWLDRYAVNRKIFDTRWEEPYLRDYGNFLRRSPLQYMRDALLRHTIAKAEWSDAEASAIERRGRGAAAALLDGGNGDGNGRLARSASSAMPPSARRPRSRPHPEEREVRYPTRAYLEGMPSNRRLRVTFLVEKMTICGGITSVVQLAREMLLAGCDVKIATLCEELAPERFNLPSQPIGFANEAEFLRLFPPSDVVVATYWSTAFDHLTALRERYDFTSVYFVQDYEVYFFPESEAEIRARVAATYTMTEHRIVKSRWLKDLVERNHGVACEQVHLGLDLEVFRNRKTDSRLGSPPRVVAVARPVERHRGFRELVEVFRGIHEARPDVELCFFGTPEAEMPRGLPFPYVNAGRIEDQQRVGELIGGSDVLVDPSLFQGFGRPGIEAMACGTACVLTSEGGVNEYARDGENCLMVKPRESTAMVAAVLRLLAEEPLRRRLHESGLETARRYCHRDEARRHLELYRKWVGERLSRRSGRPSAVATAATEAIEVAG